MVLMLSGKIGSELIGYHRICCVEYHRITLAVIVAGSDRDLLLCQTSSAIIATKLVVEWWRKHLVSHRRSDVSGIIGCLRLSSSWNTLADLLCRVSSGNTDYHRPRINWLIDHRRSCWAHLPMFPWGVYCFPSIAFCACNWGSLASLTILVLGNKV